jgi:hypothetical protein
MRLHVDWMRPLPLNDGSSQNLIYVCDIERLPAQSGVYIFGRRFGRRIEALYVGKARFLRRRIRTQLKNLPLMMHLKNARNGQRILLIGRFMAKPGQREAKCLPLIERALIRYFLAEAHDLVNIQGTRLRQHEITSGGAKRTIPDTMLLDR